ncbi:MAG: glycine--tRNA ligase subunit beta [Alphaproteobacteria bacterium]|nr:glycine--tRNA ligase subunit beta [Alphaproteobacteria bacterium]
MTQTATIIIEHGLLSERFQRTLAEHIPTHLKRLLAKNSLEFGQISVFTTPHNLVIRITQCPTEIIIKQKKLKGPSVKEGEEALNEFIKTTNCSRDSLIQKDLPHGSFWFADQKESAQSTWPILADALVNTIVTVPFHKRMHWIPNNPFTWARPILSYTALWGQVHQTLALPKAIPYDKSVSGNHITHPTRTEITRKDIEEHYEQQGVILSSTKRLEFLEKQISKILIKEQLTVPSHAKHLLEKHAFNTQKPYMVLSPIHCDFRKVDTHILQHIITEKVHGIPLIHHKTEQLTHFAVITNYPLSPSLEHNIIAGFTGVLNAALNDGLFFMDKDTEKPLEEYSAHLKKKIMHIDLGSVWDHVDRLKACVESGYTLGERTQSLTEALSLMKCDMETQMVHEYAALQGYIGHLYAIKQKHSFEVCEAIKEHLLPLGPHSPTPSSRLGAACALLDKIGMLTSSVSVGRTPTSSKDPFGLRRLALGIIRILDKHDIHISLHRIAETYIDLLGFTKKKDDILRFLHTFLQSRLAQFAKPYYPHTIIEASLHHPSFADLDIMRSLTLIRTLAQHPQTPSIIQAYKRAHNMQCKNAPSAHFSPKNPADIAFEQSLDSHKESDDLSAKIDAIALVADHIETFCNSTLIESANPEERAWRKHMLYKSCVLLEKTASFSYCT